MLISTQQSKNVLLIQTGQEWATLSEKRFFISEQKLNDDPFSETSQEAFYVELGSWVR